MPKPDFFIFQFALCILHWAFFHSSQHNSMNNAASGLAFALGSPLDVAPFIAWSGGDTEAKELPHLGVNDLSLVGDKRISNDFVF